MSTSPIRWFDREAFRRLREQRGLTLAALGRAAAVSPGTIRHWESGRNLPSIESLALVMEALEAHWPEVMPVPPDEVTLTDLRVLAMCPSGDVAEALGISASAYSALERAEIALTEERERILASMFGVSEDAVYRAWSRGKERDNP